MSDHQGPNPQLDELTEAIPVATDRQHLPNRLAKRRSMATRGTAGVGVALLVAGGGYLALARDSGTTEISAESGESSESAPLVAGSGGLSFSQRTVDGPVNYAQWSGYGPDGTLYILSSAPGAKYPELTESNAESEQEYYQEVEYQLPQAIYSTKDGETWTTTELGDIHFGTLKFQGGLLYGLTTSEGSNGKIIYEYLRSGDGGQSWDSSVIPVGDITDPPSPWLSGPGYSSANMAVTDTAHLLTITFSPEPNMKWFAEKMGITLDEKGPWLEFEPDRVVIRDYSECDRLSQEMDQRAQAIVADAMAEGMSEEEAWSKAEEEIYLAAESSGQYQEIEDACSNPPITSSKTYAELGITESLFGPNSRSNSFLSTDGINWETVEIPGDWVYTAGNGFVSEKWPQEPIEIEADEDFQPIYYTSVDGVSWSEVDSIPNDFYRQGLGQFGDQLGAFRNDEAYYSDYSEGPEDPGPTKVYFSTSTDGVNWEDTLIYENSNTDTYSYMDHAAVGPLGAVALIHSEPMEQAPSEEYTTTTIVESTEAIETIETEQADFEAYLDRVTTTILFSADGVNWSELEVNDPPKGWISNLFVTQDSIGLTYSIVDQSNGKETTKTVLLTPER